VLGRIGGEKHVLLFPLLPLSDPVLSCPKLRRINELSRDRDLIT
jgi:hypothetical protein